MSRPPAEGTRQPMGGNFILHRAGRRLAFGVLACLLGFAPLSPAIATAGHEEKTVTMAVFLADPLIKKDAEGRYSGSVLEVVEHIAEAEGWSLKYVECAFPRCLELLEAGEVDLMGSIVITEARKARFDFTHETFFMDWGQIYVPEGSDIESIVDLGGKRIAVLRDTAQYPGFEKLVHSFGLGFTPVFVDDYLDVFRVVEAGGADALMINRLFGERNFNKFKIRRTQIVFSPMDIRYAVPRGRNPWLLEALDRRLGEMKRDDVSVYHKAVFRMFGAEERAFSIPDWVKWSALMGLALILALSLAGLFLRYRVRQQTAHLLVEIAERKRVERELYESRGMFMALVEFTDAIHWEVDLASNRFTYVSPQIEKILGYPPSRWESFEDWSACVHPEDREWTRRFCMDQARTGTDHVFTYRMLSANRGVVWVRDIVKVLRADPLNKGEGKLMGIIFDVTDTESASRRVAESEKRYRALFAAMRDVVVITDRDRRMLDSNQPALREVFGYETEEIAGRLSELLYASREDFERVGHEVFAPPGPLSKLLEVACRRKNGEVFVAELFATKLLDDSGEVVGNMGILRDITERRAVEEALRDREYWLSQSQRVAQVGSYSFDIKSGTWASTDVLDEVFGLGPDYVRDVQGWLTIVHPEHREEMGRYLAHIIEARTEFDREYRIRRVADGSERWVYGRGQLTLDSTGTPVYMMGTIQDITARKIAEENILRSLKEKEVLLQEVHHRVKNNMAIISAFLSLQTRHTDSTEARELVRESQNRIHSMALVHESLYRSRDFTSIGFRGYLEQLVGDLLASYGRGKARLTLEVQETEMDLDTLIPCGLIVNELVTNSIKYALGQAPEPEISITMCSREGGVCLKIADNGPGLPEGYDIHASETLGLRIVTALASQLDGSIEYSRRTGGGAAFTLSFPYYHRGKRFQNGAGPAPGQEAI